MAAPTFDNWLRPLEVVDATADRLGGLFLLKAPNDFSRGWVSKHYGALIAESLTAITQSPWTVHWTVPPAEAQAEQAAVAAARKAPVVAPRRPPAPRSASTPRETHATA